MRVMSVFSVITRDDACSSKLALGHAVDMWINESVDVYIGPPCSVGKSHHILRSFVRVEAERQQAHDVWRTMRLMRYSRHFRRRHRAVEFK